MPGSSKLYPGERIIDDNSPELAIAVPDGMSTGYRGMFQSDASAAKYSALPDIYRVPSSEWQARITEMEETKTRVSDLIVLNKMKPKNQQSTNYCWIFAPTHLVEIKRRQQGQKHVDLSPASAGALIKNFKNVGGWGDEGLEWCVEKGLVPSEKWPDTAIDRRYATPENRALALNYRGIEWDRLKNNEIGETASSIFHRNAVAVGYNWWGHEVIVCDPVWLDGELAFRCRNSWGDRPDYPNGFFVLRGRKMIPNDAVALRTALAS